MTNTTTTEGLTVYQLARLMHWSPEDVKAEILDDRIGQLWLREDGMLEPWILVEITFLAELAELYTSGQLTEPEADALWDAMEEAFPQLGEIALGRAPLPTDGDLVIMSHVGDREIDLHFFETIVRDLSR